MKQLKDILFEKLKVNSSTKINDSLIDKIIETWGVEYYKNFYKKYYHDLYKILEVWIKGCDVKDVKFYCPAWGINKMEEHKIPKYIRDEYIICDENNEYVYDYLKDNPDILIDTDDMFTDKDNNKHGIYVVSDNKHIISFNVEGCAPRICHKEN